MTYEDVLVVDINVNDIIREKAYFLWEEAGKPKGDGVDFWLQAEQEIMSDLMTAEEVLADLKNNYNHHTELIDPEFFM